MIDRVSVHGGHSGEFCGHAEDRLEDVVRAYIEQRFRWVCLTEHIAPGDARFTEGERGSVADLDARFARYFDEARRLQEHHRDDIEIFVGFETEAFSGYQKIVADLIERYQPDMIVGSVHHVRDIPFDFSPQHYARAVAAAGGIETLYADYFDLQLELIECFRPAVVGHFDLIRIFDADYRQRWTVPAIRERALRNLDRIGELGLVLDFNLRALAKGADEPYVSEPWLRHAIDRGIALIPGDDSHGVASVGNHFDRGVDILRSAGGNTDWPVAKLRQAPPGARDAGTVIIRTVSDEHDQLIARARGMFDQYQAAMAATRDVLDGQLARAVELISELDSILILTGLGKSGLVAQKASATLSSTGTQTAFVHPVEALHGDLGIVRPGSAMLALSKSGENEETIEFARQFKAVVAGGKVICITEPGSSLAGIADIALTIPVLREIDDYNLVPTTSTLATMAVCDVLAVLVQQRKGLNEHDFARFHPSGALGERLRLLAGDLMLQGDRLPMVAKDARFSDLVAENTSKGLGMALIVDGDAFLGVVTDADIRRLHLRGEDTSTLTAEECFKRSRRGAESNAPTKVRGTAMADDTAFDCLRQMQQNRITQLVILDADETRVVGIVRMQDLIDAGI